MEVALPLNVKEVPVVLHAVGHRKVMHALMHQMLAAAPISKTLVPLEAAACVTVNAQARIANALNAFLIPRQDCV